MIRIQGHDYRCLFDEGIVSRRLHAGEHSAIDGTITIAPSQDESHQKETLIHELIEAIKSAFDLDMPHSHVQALSAGLYQIIADNPKVFRMTLPEGDAP